MGFAQDYWKDFEELSIDLIKLLFKDYHFDKHIEKTQNSKDGGYDGVVLISDNKHNVYKAISESKLRKLSRKDLPLSDFAKTLIISVNLCADKVYIFTNLHFSNETQNRIEKFSRGTNIKVQLFDIVEIVGLIPKLADDILKNYPTEFIEKLQNSVTDHPRKLSLNPAPKINLKKECELLGIERKKQFAETVQNIEHKYYESLDNSNKYQLFIYLLQSYVCINEFGEKIELCIDELETFTLSAEANCDFLFWKAKYYLVKGDYEKITKELNNYIKEDPRLYYMYALGIKHLYGIDKCIEELNAAQILYPDNWLIKYSYYDHNLSKVFKTDIKLAVEYIRQMQVFTSKLSLEDFFHYEYNKLVVAFYNKQLKSSQELEYLMQNCYKNNLSVEQSRVCNLLGQFYWCNNDIKKAIHYFEIGKMIQHQTDHHTYWWISNTNLALLYFEQNRYDECLQSINCIVNKYCENKWKKIVRFFSQKNIISSQLIDDKEITSFMLILWIAYSIDKEEGHRIIQSINLQNSTSLHQAYFDLNFLDNFVNGTLKQTNYFFESHYMIKC